MITQRLQELQLKRCTTKALPSWQRSKKGRTKMTDVLALLDRVGAVSLDRHFVYKSGKHGTGYINMDPLFPDVNAVSGLCRRLSEPFAGQFDTVASPAVGGVVLA